MDKTKLITPEALSDELGVPVKTLAQWRYLGTGPAYLRVGRFVRYRRSDVDGWLGAQVQKPKGAA
ncbi:MAG: helix-turn-helix domain-containing protein [Kineosporiaceae bacterium]|nr:helix-turn-helix domain-containing protein [Kineosporiaceae bacterium]